MRVPERFKIKHNMTPAQRIKMDQMERTEVIEVNITKDGKEDMSDGNGDYTQMGLMPAATGDEEQRIIIPSEQNQSKEEIKIQKETERQTENAIEQDRRKLEKREEDKAEAKNKKHETRQRVRIVASEDKK